MKHLSSSVVLALMVSSAAPLSGCLAFDEGLDEEGIEDVGAAEQRVVAGNALTVNALTTNALTTNALTTNALTTNALTTNALVMDALTDELTRELFAYVVSCALPAGSHVDLTIDGVTYVFSGQIGIFPQWGNASGSCEVGCQHWVSGCVLARVNYLGAQVPISVRGNKAPLVLGPTESKDFPRREATYYGNIFAQQQVRYACLSPGETLNERVCGPSLEGCVMDVVGTCDMFCGPAHTSGAFPNCRNMPRDPATGAWPTESRSFPGSITVFLKP